MKKKFFALLLFLLFSLFQISLFIAVPAFSEEKKIETLQVEIIKDKKEKEKPKIIYDPVKIEEVRKITKLRILALLVFWAIVLTLYIMLRIKIKEDRRLLEEGYYETELEH